MAAEAWHAEPIDEGFARLQSSPAGLSEQEAQERLQRFGPNQLDPPKPVSPLKIFTDQLRSVVVLLLVAAAGVALALGERIDAAAIAVVLAINTLLGFVTELRARRAMAALLKLDVPRAFVVRDGQVRAVDAHTLVPGDVIELNRGQQVPADGRVIEAADLRTDEAALTGESLPVSKSVEPLPRDTLLAERTDMVYKGTTVVAGIARVVVTATGKDTELGRIGALVGGVREERAPLERRLDELGRRLVWIALAVAGLVAALGALHGAPLGLVVQTGIALAVAAVPEALPAVATIALAVGVWRMAHRNALVRRLPAVEALGSTTVVCTDKTRTLTSGDMTVARIWTAGKDIDLAGIDRLGGGDDVRRLLEVAALATQDAASGGPDAGGDPVDKALVEAAARFGIDRARLLESQRPAGIVPFSSERKLMASFHRKERGTSVRAPSRGWGPAPLNMDTEGSRLLLEESSGEESARLGERFYRRGVGVNGEPVSATVQGDLPMRSTDVPCVNCHRRSGLGSFEGSVTVPPVAGHVLFEPVTLGPPQMGFVRTTGAGTRPAYDESTLARALRDGIDPGGRRLSPTMPRYAVGYADVAALSVYLRSFSSGPPPGVTPTTLHLATITSETLDPSKRADLLDTLQAFVASKNANTRGEVRRRDQGPWDMKPHYEGFRRWVLHEWSLRGSARDWADQLAKYYASQPVFAVVSGAAEADWSPIHDFCERNGVPCILPQTDVPPIRPSTDGFYSLYFSQGLTLEAQALAHYLTSARAPPRRDILQVLRCGSPAERGAIELSRALDPGVAARTQCLDAFTPAAWRGVLEKGAAVLVLWVGVADLAGLGELAKLPDGLKGVGEIYVSSSLLGDAVETLAGPLADKAFLLHPFVLPDDFDRHAGRVMAWLKAHGVARQQRRVSVNALFAASLVGDVLSHPRTLGSREYFIERIEHMIGRSPQPSAFPALSLAPQRRFASLGSYVLKVPSGTAESFAKVADWWAPEVRVGQAEESK